MDNLIHLRISIRQNIKKTMDEIQPLDEKIEIIQLELMRCSDIYVPCIFKNLKDNDIMTVLHEIDDLKFKIKDLMFDLGNIKFQKKELHNNTNEMKQKERILTKIIDGHYDDEWLEIIHDIIK